MLYSISYGNLIQLFNAEMLSSSIRVLKRQVFRLTKSVRPSLSVFVWLNAPGILVLNLLYALVLYLESMNIRLILLCRVMMTVDQRLRRVASRLFYYYYSMKRAPNLFFSLMLINMRKRLRRAVQCPFISIKID